MKKLIQVLIFLLLLSIVSNAQDTLVTTLGAVHVGKFIEQKKNQILFIPSGSKFDIPQNLPIEMIRYIKSPDGSILYDKESKNRESDLVQLKVVSPSDTTIVQNRMSNINTNYMKRTVEALEEIATVEKFFMNYTIVMTVLTVILLVISIK